MKLIAIDLEMNKPDGEIIELGYVIYDFYRKKFLEEKSLLIKTNLPIHPEIIELTGITENDLKLNSYPNLEEAYNILVADITKHEATKHVVQWGTDHLYLKNKLGLSWQDYVFKDRAWDVKSAFQMWCLANNIGMRKGLGAALETLGLRFEGRQHRAASDAKNTIYVLVELLKKLKKG